jgi:hypothetical protein
MRIIVIFIATLLFVTYNTAFANISFLQKSSLYNDDLVTKLAAEAPKLRPSILKLALKAFISAHQKGIVQKPILTVIDYSLPSTEPRLWTFDITNQKLLFHTLVAHGKGNGDNYVTKVSDRPGSLASPVGLYVTADTYFGHRGYSLVIKGLDFGFNDRAESRRIVMHGAWYVNESIAKTQGRIGRSWGCPAVKEELAAPIINTIKGKSALFAYFPEKAWLSKSKYLQV